MEIVKSIKNYIHRKVNKTIVIEECPIHLWFELTYAHYLTVPRSVLEAMPQEWKERFAKCLEELDNTIDWRPKEGRYWCYLRDAKGRYREDPFSEYRHPYIKMPYIKK